MTCGNVFLDKWDERFLSLASEISTWSKDPKRKVGAVLVKDRSRFSVGYNGFPPGIEDTEHRLYYDDIKQQLTNHAEINALLNAAKIGFTTEGCSLYCTFHPCNRCAVAIISAGVKKVVCPPPEICHESKWLDSQKLASDTLAEAKVTVYYANDYSRTESRIAALCGGEKEAD